MLNKVVIVLLLPNVGLTCWKDLLETHSFVLIQQGAVFLSAVSFGSWPVRE